jgi:predicted 3-demethylubiquinone-9 3-methyltransferase (glyoxalase superfamily)
MDKVSPFLWFDTEAEDAARLYVSLFPNSRILEIARYGEAGPRPKGTVMTVAFELDGRRFIALNGGPEYSLTEAFSLSVDCEDQAEVDRLWDVLSDGGKPGPCGWLKDRYGLSWQITPRALMLLLGDPDRDKAGRVMRAMLKMGKIEVAALEAAAAATA